MAQLEFLKPTFERLATKGVIGDPAGELAYAYLRVSSDDQADNGRSGLPRQLQHIHEVSCSKGYKVAWDFVFADDHTGLEFKDRPQLSNLRHELRSPQRRANAVVIEELDRLSRNAVWHQGFLLEEMESLGIRVIFWKEFTSLIERTVTGILAQEAIKQEKRRMMEGNLHKARSGRVTARVAAYGYRLVDSNGNEGFNAKKDTYYAIFEEEALIVRHCFERLIAGDPLRRIALDLQMAGVPPPKKYKYWIATQVRLFITNEVYKGDFYAHRWNHTTIEKPAKNGIGTQKVKLKLERPRDEWIHIPVPAIVSPEVWEAANHMLEQNKKTARRNAIEPYLLTGLVKCAYCGWTFTGTTHRIQHGKPRKIPYRGYRCPHHSVRPKYLSEHIECNNSYIRCDILDGIVWGLVSKALLEPQVLLEALDADATSERNRELQQHIAYLERELEAKNTEDERLYRAYVAGAFDETEYAARRKMLKEDKARQAEECTRLREQLLSPEQLEERKELVLKLSQELREQNIPVDPPFELKQRILKLVVDEIQLSVGEGWLKLNGAIRGQFPIVNTSVDMDCEPERGENLQEMSPNL